MSALLRYFADAVLARDASAPLAASESELFDWLETGHADDGDTRAAVLDYIVIRDGAGNDPDLATHRADLAAAYYWGRVLAALELASGSPANDDDRGMQTATARGLLAWVADLRDRVGLCVDDMETEILDYIGERDTERALSIVAPLAPQGWNVQPFDPRGMAIAGAEMHNPEGTHCVGLYVDEIGAWEVAYNDERCVTEGDSVDDGDGGSQGLDETCATAAVRERLAAWGAA